MKKVFYWANTILQVFLFFAALGIQELSMKKMGMMRYVVFINRQWETQYPIVTVRYSAIIFLVVLFTIIVLSALRGNYLTNKKVVTMLIVGGIITFSFVFFALAYTTESYRSYYFTSLILALMALLQDIKTIIFLKSECSCNTYKF